MKPWRVRGYGVTSGDLIAEEPFRFRLGAVMAARLLKWLNGTRWSERRALTRGGVAALFMEPMEYRIERADQ